MTKQDKFSPNWDIRHRHRGRQKSRVDQHEDVVEPSLAL